MKLLNRLKFAIGHDIVPGYIIVPFGGEYNPVKFVHYKDAKAFAKEEASKKPMYGEPAILVKLERHQ